MLSDCEQERYSRQIMLPEVGESGQEVLKKAHVLCVGAGGLGECFSAVTCGRWCGLCGYCVIMIMWLALIWRASPCFQKRHW